jgi:diguanylate cyclase (GGDEF)-like protein
MNLLLSLRRNKLFLFSLCLVCFFSIQTKLIFADDHPETLDSQTLDLKISEIDALIQLADNKVSQALYEQALEALTKAYDLSKTLDSNELSSNVLNSIANVYFNTGQLEQAHRYYTELVAIDEASGNQQSLSVSLFNLGHANATLKEYAEAEANFQQSLALSRALSDDSGTAFTLKALGVNAQAQSNYELARTYLQEALQLFETIHDQQQIAAVHRHLGDIAQQEHQYQLAVSHYETALPALGNNSFDVILLRTYRGLSTAYEKLQEYDKAYISQRVYTQLLQQQLEQRNQETMQRLQVQFETQQFSDKNKRLELVNQSQQQELQHRQTLLQMQYLVIGLAIGVILLVVILWWRSRIHAKNMQMLATVDSLTGLLNRRAILEYGNNEWQRAHRFDRPLCCLILDIDHFKTINDTFGHASGDHVLRTISDNVKKSLRKTDAFGRFGGEEFLLISTETDLHQAETLAERIRHDIESTTFSEISDHTVTVSIGIAIFDTQETLDELISHADEALYLAKNRGRNQAVTYQSTANQSSD